MMSPDEVKRLVEQSISSTHVIAKDMTGTGDHFEVSVASAEFKGKTLIEQHQIVHRALDGALTSGRIHALKIKTFVSEK